MPQAPKLEPLSLAEREQLRQWRLPGDTPEETFSEELQSWRSYLESGHVIGAPATVGSFMQVADEILRAAHEGSNGYVCAANVHMVTTARRDAELRAVMDDALIVASDGMPLVWDLCRQGFAAERVAGPDLTFYLCERAAAEGLPVYFYGGSPATLNRLVRALEATFPDLVISGYESPPALLDKPTLDMHSSSRIAASGARLVFVGLGCPKQEFWMATHAPWIPAVQIGVGAAFDFLAGAKPRAPQWMQRRGLEWLFRLASEPRRLWKRYLVNNTLFILHLIREYVTPPPPRKRPSTPHLPAHVAQRLEAFGKYVEALPDRHLETWSGERLGGEGVPGAIAGRDEPGEPQPRTPTDLDVGGAVSGDPASGEVEVQILRSA